jgi:hypothetical protein
LTFAKSAVHVDDIGTARVTKAATGGARIEDGAILAYIIHVEPVVAAQAMRSTRRNIEPGDGSVPVAVEDVAAARRRAAALASRAAGACGSVDARPLRLDDTSVPTRRSAPGGDHDAGVGGDGACPRRRQRFHEAAFGAGRRSRRKR